MATVKATTRRRDGREPQAGTRSRLETSPERVALIKDVINAVIATGGHLAQDAICQDDDVRALAAQLRLPYLEVQIIVNGPTPLSETDVKDYNAWRAALDKAGAR
jgi:hypothetical protein